MSPIYKPGQKVWLVLSGNRVRAYGTTIAKVGRKWATLDHGGFRFDMKTGRLDGGDCSSFGRVYLTRELYETEVKREQAWARLRSQMHNYYGKPGPGVTLEGIEQARKLLGLEVTP